MTRIPHLTSDSPEELAVALSAAIREMAAVSLKKQLLVAIDGRCAAGKTTLARAFQSITDCNIIPMDDFFLRPEQRSEERLSTPGGNVDRERFLEEVLNPLKEGSAFSYRPYRCSTGHFAPSIPVTPKQITLIEGSYSCHPALFPCYDLTVFLDVDPAVQRARLLAREGEESAERFFSRWIPLEERYFDAFAVRRNCRLLFESR